MNELDSIDIAAVGSLDVLAEGEGDDGCTPIGGVRRVHSAGRDGGLAEDTELGVPEHTAGHDVHERDVGDSEHGSVGDGDGFDIEHDHSHQVGGDSGPGRMF